MTEHAYERTPLTLATGAAHTVKLPPRVMRGRLTGFLFDTNKTFILPAALTGIRGLASFYAAHPGLKVLVTGHTDTVGPDAANLTLADELAAAVANLGGLDDARRASASMIAQQLPQDPAAARSWIASITRPFRRRP